MPYNEQNPVWKDTFENTIDTANKTLSVKRTDNDGNHSGWGQNLVFKGYAKDIINDTQFNSLNGKYNVSYQNMIRPGVTMEVNDGKMRQTNKDGNNIFDEKIKQKILKINVQKKMIKIKPFM